MVGRFCRLEALDPARHGVELFEANARDTRADVDLHGLRPVPTARGLSRLGRANGSGRGSAVPCHRRAGERQGGGRCGLLRIEPAVGADESATSPTRTLAAHAAATEAMYPLMRRVFDERIPALRVEVRRAQRPVAAAGRRLGFRFEGIFRQAAIQGASWWDTARYSVTDSEWPARRAAFEAWLEPANFAGDGRQRRHASPGHPHSSALGAAAAQRPSSSFTAARPSPPSAVVTPASHASRTSGCASRDTPWQHPRLGAVVEDGAHHLVLHLLGETELGEQLGQVGAFGRNAADPESGPWRCRDCSRKSRRHRVGR